MEKENTIYHNGVIALLAVSVLSQSGWYRGLLMIRPGIHGFVFWGIFL
ncbi:MAG: hypothetical protein HFI71_12725 [Lachnospiraceae bacterium]|nr:hypothetical protein [Lachnospiraceae bacterium]